MTGLSQLDLNVSREGNLISKLTKCLAMTNAIHGYALLRGSLVEKENQSPNGLSFTKLPNFSQHPALDQVRRGKLMIECTDNRYSPA